MVEPGDIFGRWIAVYRTKRRGYWLCMCACTKEKEIFVRNLTSGKTKSCGCLRIQKMLGNTKTKTHGMTNSVEYKCWDSMLERCRNPEHHAWSSYGGRGIKVCRRWYKFENFFKDMGFRPKGKSIDRINNDGNYESKNCRWATPKQQANNRRPKSLCLSV